MVPEIRRLTLRRSWCKPLRRYPSGLQGCSISVKTPLDRPDPAIYSQEELLALGQIPTWDSPDIITSWLPTPGWTLLPETLVTVRNLSQTVSAINALVHLYTSPFGLGMQRMPLSTQILTLAPGGELKLKFPLTQDLLSGDQRIGIYVFIEHPHDKVKINSHGYQMIYAVRSSEGGLRRVFEFNFPVVNQSAISQQITLSVMPNDLGAINSPTVRNFAPWEQSQATLALQIPDVLHGTSSAEVRKEITVVAWDDTGSLIDGLTYIVRIDD